MKKKHTFDERRQQAEKAGLKLERDRLGKHPYCLWFNSPSGSKEIWIANLTVEFEEAYNELIDMKRKGI